MDNCIYGVDITKDVTPLMVRDAIISCFLQAHKEILEQMKEFHEFKSEEEFKNLENISVKMLIESAFRDSGGDFNNPTKESLMNVMNTLRDYALKFRKPEIINEHAAQILQLIGKLD